MRTVLLLSFVTTFTASVVAQTPPAKSPSPQNSTTKSPAAQTAPAPAPAPAPQTQPAKAPPATTGQPKTTPTTGRGSTTSGSRTGLAMNVTDMRGGPLDDVHVELTGPMMRA